MSRTKKKAYTGSKRFDVTCRNHGSCSYCRDNRLHKFNYDLDKMKIMVDGETISLPEDIVTPEDILEWMLQQE